MKCIHTEFHMPNFSTLSLSHLFIYFWFNGDKWKYMEVVMADYKVLCYHLSGETEEDHEDLVYIGGFQDKIWT